MTANENTVDTPLLLAAGGAFPYGGPLRVGVAVSGGGDSMALLHLMVGAAAARSWAVHAVTVDHGLRPEAVDEARFVAKACKALKVSHDTLRWEHGRASGNLQDQARQARYGLIADWAEGRGITHVALGHTADDQAETFLMELARAAGLDGLSGMRRVWAAQGIHWSRPLLDHTRAELRAYLTRHGLKWIEDPSNEDERFARVKARKILAGLAPLGIGAETLAGVAENLSMARAGLDAAVTEAAGRVARDVAGEVILDRDAFSQIHSELRRRILIGTLKWVSGEAFPPRSEPLARVETAIREGKSRTLHGCRIRLTDTEIRISREPKAVAQTGKPEEIWDGRWRLSGPGKRGLTVRALGAEGLKTCENWRETGASREALVVSPAVFRGEKLVAAPLAGMANGWTAEPRRPFYAAFTRH